MNFVILSMASLYVYFLEAINILNFQDYNNVLTFRQFVIINTKNTL